jgi:hypothetical protein
VSSREPAELRREIELERARLADAARRLRTGVEAAALPRRIPWAIVAAAFLAGVALGRRLR